jgi:hypothetical protein
VGSTVIVGRAFARWASTITASVLLSTRVGGQSADARVPLSRVPLSRTALSVGAMATGVFTRATPAVFDQTASEAYLTQPNVMLIARRGGWQWNSTLNLEGYTLRRGELTPGIYGEGYIDRRHPHTLVHEAMGSYARAFGRTVQASLSAGKGFTPFGSDDPMMRPFVKFPVNHHHSQIIERVQAVGAVSVGSAR